MIRDPAQPAPWFFISRRGQRLKSRDDFEAYRKASLLPKGQLHPLIASEVYPAFLRGKYDTAIFEAFREVEVAVREAGKFGPDDYGTELMREAFKPSEKKSQAITPGPLTDTKLPVAEQEAMASLFAGAIGLYKNPQSHRHVPTHAEEAAEVIVFASHLLRLVDRLKP
ncbi:MAG: TIGR02391 family protein [Candidatus Acidiferrales bacterium]